MYSSIRCLVIIDPDSIAYRKHFYDPETIQMAKSQEDCLESTVEKSQNYYEILGLNATTADANAIRRAYIAKSLLYHPDKNTMEDTTESFIRIAQAYETLILEKSRRRYDQQLQMEEQLSPTKFDFWSNEETANMIKLNANNHDSLIRHNKYWVVYYHFNQFAKGSHREIVKDASLLFSQMNEIEDFSNMVAFGDFNCKPNPSFCVEKGMQWNLLPVLRILDTSHPRLVAESFNRTQMVDFAPSSMILAGYAKRLAYAKTMVPNVKNIDDILRGNSIWLVYFDSPKSCPLCHRFMEYFRRLAGRIPSSISVGKVNCNAHQAICHKFVGGVFSERPRLLLFRPGVHPVSLLDFIHVDSLREQGFAMEILEKVLNVFGVVADTPESVYNYYADERWPGEEVLSGDRPSSEFHNSVNVAEMDGKNEDTILKEDSNISVEAAEDGDKKGEENYIISVEAAEECVVNE
jgi:hypothetical protein